MFGPRVVRRRPLLRAAVVGGTAYAAGRHSAQAQGADTYQGQQPAQPMQTAPQQAASSEPSMMDQLGQLNTLHQQGALTDEEFASAKAKLLGS